MKKLFPEFVNYFEKNGFELVEDSGTNLVYKKALINNQRSNKFLFLAVESKFANLMYGYIITKDGSKVKSANVPFSKNYKPEDVEIIIRMITDEFHVMGHLNQLPKIEEPPVKQEKDLTKLYDLLNELVDNADQKGKSDMTPIDKMYFSLVEREKQAESNKNLELIALYTKEIENNPKNKVAYYNRGIIKTVLEDYMGAISDYRKAIEIDSNYSDAIESLSTAIEYEELKKEVEVFRLDTEKNNNKRLTSISNIAIENNKETVTDIDGNVYKTVRIGDQVWMAENLKVRRYRNGEIIPHIIDDNEWTNFEDGTWCNYDNNSVYDAEYGKLYNWYAVDDNRGLAPEGWHVPSEEEWDILIDYLGGYEIAGNKLKSLYINEWSTNESGFTALAGGGRNGNNGMFHKFGDSFDWWSSTPFDTKSAKGRDMFSYDSDIHWFNIYKTCGASVRCVQDGKERKTEEVNDVFETVCKGNLYGFKNSKGEMITKYKYESVTNFCEGRAMVSINSKYGYINKAGKEIIPLIYDLAESWIDWVVPKDYYNFRNGLVRIVKDEKYGFLDTHGKTIIPIVYDSASLFKDDFVIVSKNYKYGFLNAKGETVIPLIYDNAHNFCEGLAAVNLNDKWGYIDKKGNTIIPLIYNSAMEFSEGVAAIKINNQYGFIDNIGRMVIPNIYYDCYNPSDNFEYDESKYLLYHFKNGLCLVGSEFHKFSLINISGEYIKNVSVCIYQT